MTNSEQKVLDDIDALVDWQLQQEASGYDNNINQPPLCRCGEDWHALPITQDLLRARFTYQATGEMPSWYRYEDDVSSSICPGSDSEGPLAGCGCFVCNRKLTLQAMWAPTLSRTTPAVTVVTPRTTRSRRGDELAFVIYDEVPEFNLDPWQRSVLFGGQRWEEVVLAGVGQSSEVVRPRHQPPMWAVDPAHSRRPRHGRGHRRVR